MEKNICNKKTKKAMKTKIPATITLPSPSPERQARRKREQEADEMEPKTTKVPRRSVSPEPRTMLDQTTTTNNNNNNQKDLVDHFPYNPPTPLKSVLKGPKSAAKVPRNVKFSPNATLRVFNPEEGEDEAKSEHWQSIKDQQRLEEIKADVSEFKAAIEADDRAAVAKFQAFGVDIMSAMQDALDNVTCRSHIFTLDYVLTIYEALQLKEKYINLGTEEEPNNLYFTKCGIRFCVDAPFLITIKSRPMLCFCPSGVWYYFWQWKEHAFARGLKKNVGYLSRVSRGHLSTYFCLNKQLFWATLNDGTGVLKKFVRDEQKRGQKQHIEELDSDDEDLSEDEAQPAAANNSHQDQFWAAMNATAQSLKQEREARQAGETILHGRIEQTNGRMDQVEKETKGRIDQVEKETNGRIDQVEKEVYARLDALEAPKAPRKPVRNDGFQADLAHTPLLEPFWLASQNRYCKKCLASKSGRCTLDAHNP